MDKRYNRTLAACFVGYIVQAIVNNFAPLLFLTFHDSMGIPLTKITILITFNFVIQLLVDLLSVGFVDRIGYRASMVIAHVCAAAGLVGMTVLPQCTADPFAGLLASVTLYALGGGLLEVLVSPVVEACPTENKETAMSMLHSFYCWGHVGVVLLSTLFFGVFGTSNWRVLSLLWALVPVCNGILFLTVPIAPLMEEGEKGFTVKELLEQKIFWILTAMMICAGASEQAVSQWASTFAELGLGVGKTVGDLAGPMAFAILMGSARAFYGKYGNHIDLDRFMACSSILCILAYLCIVFLPHPICGLIGCAVTGLSVGIMWPGTFSKASASLKRGGTVMYAFLALAGDIGCSGGPTLVGFVSGRYGDNLRTGILAAVVFPVLLLLGIVLLRERKRREQE